MASVSSSGAVMAGVARDRIGRRLIVRWVNSSLATANVSAVVVFHIPVQRWLVTAADFSGS